MDSGSIERTTYRSTLLRLSRLALLAMLFFSPWMLAWPIDVPGLNTGETKLRLADGLALISVAAYALAGWPGRGRLRLRLVRIYAGASLLLIAWAFASTLWAAHPATALAFSIRLLWWVAVALRVACDNVPPRQIAIALLSGLLLQTLIGLVQFGLQHHLGLSALGEMPIDLAYPGVSVISAGEQTLIRLYGLSGHPNVIGGYAAIALLLGVGLLRERHARWRALWRALWLIGLIGLLLTFSRSALVGVLIGLSVIALLWRPNRRRALRVIVSGGIVVGIFMLVFAPFVISRLSGTVATEQVSIDERLAQTVLAWQLLSHHPLGGVGAGNSILYNSAPGPGLSAQRIHNVPLLIASELGLPGLVLWLISVGAVIVAGIRSSRAATVIWPIALTSALVALLVIAQFDYYGWTSSQGVYVWATICGALLATVSAEPDR